MGAAAAAAAVGAAISAVGTIGAAVINSGSKGSAGSGSSPGTSNQDTNKVENSQTQQSGAHTPWDPQGTAIQGALTGAQSVYDARTAAGPYQGDMIAGRNPYTAQVSISAGQYANGEGQTAIANAGRIAGDGVGAMTPYLDHATYIASQGLGTTANGALTGALSNIGSGSQAIVRPALSDALHSAATAGAGSIGSYDAGLASIMDNAQADPTAAITQSAKSYMDNGATQAMLDNVNGQIDKTLNETTNPGLNRQASMGGSLNSSRSAMAEAMANRDAALAKGNADAQILNNAYNTGLSTAANQRTAGMNTALAAGTAGLYGNTSLALGTGNQDISGTQTQIGAATAGLSADTARDTANSSARIAGNAQLLSGVNTGLTANQQQQTLAAGNASLLSNAGILQQSTDQADLTNAYQKWQNGNQYQQGVLNDYMSNVTKPSGYYNATQNTNNASITNTTAAGTSTSTPPSMLPQLLAGGATAIGAGLAPGGALSKYFSDGTNGVVDPNGSALQRNGANWNANADQQAMLYNQQYEPSYSGFTGY